MKLTRMNGAQPKTETFSLKKAAEEALADAGFLKLNWDGVSVTWERYIPFGSLRAQQQISLIYGKITFRSKDLPAFSVIKAVFTFNIQRARNCHYCLIGIICQHKNTDNGQ